MRHCQAVRHRHLGDSSAGFGWGQTNQDLEHDGLERAGPRCPTAQPRRRSSSASMGGWQPDGITGMGPRYLAKNLTKNLVKNGQPDSFK